MKLFGHPLHPLFIHFPTALLPMDLVLSILYNLSGNTSFYQAGFYCLVGGSALGILSAITGLIELIAIPKWDRKAIALALYHGFVNGLIVITFSIITYTAWLNFPSPYLSGTTGIAIKSFLIITLFVGNYMGGKLIYEYHIGINIKQNLHGKAAA